MSESDISPPPGNTEAKLLLFLFLAVSVWVIVVFLLGRFPWAAIPTAYALPIILGLSLFIAIRLARHGSSPIPIALGTAGVLFIAGGVTFDVVATVIHSPTLQNEGNPIARTLLDSGHSLPFVYGYSIISQALYLAVNCTLWLALLRHRDILIASLQGHSSFMRFLKAATGAADLTWRQWMIPLKISELPRAYPLFWTVVVLLVACTLDRWYLGLEWFHLVSFPRWIVIVAAGTLGLAAYFVWLWTATRRTQSAI